MPSINTLRFCWVSAKYHTLPVYGASRAAQMTRPGATGEVCSMPKGPRGEHRPADVIGCAITVAKIATSELVENLKLKSGKTRSGKAGGQARAEKLTREERREIAQMAAIARWKK